MANRKSKSASSCCALVQIACTAGTVMVLSGTAHAQSSVTLYGVADAGFTYSSNAGGKKLLAMTTGNYNSNRWGLTGAEDLGGDLKAIFTLEAGFSLNTGAIGQNGTEFGRQAFVGLSSSRYGTVTLGRQYPVSSPAVSAFAASNWAAGGAGYGAHPGDIDNLDTSVRVNNSIKYQSPDVHGLTFGALYALGNKPGNVTGNQVYDFVLSYAHGPVAASVGFLRAKSPNYAFYGTKANDSSTASNMTSPVNDGYASAGSVQILSAGTSYALGAATVGLVYSNVRYDNLGATSVAGLNATEAAYRGSATFNVGEISLKYNITPALLLGASYAYTRDSGVSGAAGAHYNQIDLGGRYSLSKRTAVYLVSVYQTASGRNSTGVPAVASVFATTPSASKNQWVTTIGFQNKF